MARSSSLTPIACTPPQTPRRAGASVWAWLTEWADAFAEARAYAQLRRRLEDYDDHMLIDVGLRRVGGRIEAMSGSAAELAYPRERKDGKWANR